MSETAFVVYAVQHRVFGKQVCVQFAEDFVLKLTLSEASSLSFALLAMRDGKSIEREIYMSPIACDVAFSGYVHDCGISIPDARLELSWTDVGLLAGNLAAAIG